MEMQLGHFNLKAPIKGVIDIIILLQLSEVDVSMELMVTSCMN